MAKKYPTSSEKDALSVKEQSTTPAVEGKEHVVTKEMMQKAISHVIKVHGAALEQLAK